MIESLVKLILRTQPYTEDGLNVKNPAVGYPLEMVTSICSEVPTRKLGDSCIWAHGNINANLTILDHE